MRMVLDQRHSRAGALAFVLTLAVVATVALAPGSAQRDSLLPHGYCYRWDPSLLRLHLVSDALIGLAYIAIPLVLVHFIRKREDLPFNWMFLLFGLFIIACGSTHWMEVWTLWNPDYWLAGSVKAITAAASVPTAILLYLLVPHALALPSTRQLREAKEALEREVQARTQAQAALEDARATLERRVAERTQALEDAHGRLQAQHALLEAADREKNRFLAVLSHEIRNPLHAIGGSAALLRLTDEPAARERAIAAIERQVGRLGGLLEDLLDVARTTREITLRPAPMDLRRAVEGGIETTESFYRERGQRVAVEMPAGRVPVHGDVGRLEQVVVNFLHNASRHSPPGSTITARVEAAHGMATLEVRDPGEGLDPEQRERVFDFFAHPGSADTHGGLGIGLNIVKQIVLAHGGTVAAESEGRGKGSRFVVRMPLATEEGNAAT